MGAVAAIGSLALGAFSAYQSYEAGQEAEERAEENAERVQQTAAVNVSDSQLVAEENAALIRREAELRIAADVQSTQEEQRRLGYRQDKIESEARARAAASGVELDSLSTRAFLNDLYGQHEMELNFLQEALSTRTLITQELADSRAQLEITQAARESDARSVEAQYQAENYRDQGDLASTQGTAAAVGQVVDTGSDFYDAGTKYQWW